MTDDGSLYYNYSNKGSVYQFDLSKLTPEERQKFSRLNDRQKRRFITLFDLEEPGKMKNEVAIRPDFNDDKANERNNDLRTLTAKMEYIDNIKNPETLKRSLNDAKFQKVLLNDSNGLITSTDMGYVLSANKDATLATLKKYYQAMIDNLRTEGESMKLKKTLLGANFSKSMGNASASETSKLLTDILSSIKDFGPKFEDVLKTVKKYGFTDLTEALSSNDLSKKAQDKIKEVKEAEETLTEVMSKVFNKPSGEISDYIKNHREVLITEINDLLKQIDSEKPLKLKNLDVDNIDMEEKEEQPYSYLTDNQQSAMKDILDDIEMLDDDTIKAEQYNTVAKQLMKSFNIKDNVKELAEKSEKGKKDLSKASIYNYIGELINQNIYKPSDMTGKIKIHHRLIDKVDKGISDNILKYVSTLNAIDENNKIAIPTIKEFQNDIDGKSGSIKDRIKRIFRGDLEDRTKTLSDTSSKQSQEIEGLKKRIDSLEAKIDNLKTQPQSISPISPVPKPSVSSQSFLDSIREAPNKPLKPVEVKPKPVVEDNDLESQLRKVMEYRRKDIAYDEPSEDDDDDWAAGIGGIPKIVSLADFLSMK